MVSFYVPAANYVGDKAGQAKDAVFGAAEDTKQGAKKQTGASRAAQGSHSQACDSGFFVRH